MNNPIPYVCKFKHIYIYISYLHKLHFIYITKKSPPILYIP